MNKEVRVRFAPSPTGFLHIGGARTAIFNWIFARHNGGKFLLRIEDTDQKRSTQEYFDAILSSLKWLGVDWDEDYTVQSGNIDLHRSEVSRLIKSGSAYKCFCSPEILEKKKHDAQQEKLPEKYDRTCLMLSEDEISDLESKNTPYVIRFKVPEGETVFNDLIHGKTVFQNIEIDDFVILRADDTPTYQSAVVVDDHNMDITHIIRGNDHLSNTPKQIMLFNAFGWDVPDFAHMPMILGPDKTRLSKRHGAVSLEHYRDQGYLCDALFNYLTLLGWSPGNDREVVSKEEIIEKFGISDTSKKSAVFDEVKLQWINNQYITAMDISELAELIKRKLVQDIELGRLVEERGKDYLLQVLDLQRSRFRLLTDFIPFAGYFYRGPVTYDPAAVKKHWLKNTPDVLERLARVRLSMKECDNYSEEGIEQDIRWLAEELDISAAKLIHPTRLALTGYGVSPGLFELMLLLGQETVIRRLEKAVTYL
ncbi:glutamate--tRNA ligase, partial [candidate division KSB1 bacterium]